jgi:hypothetical protein
MRKLLLGLLASVAVAGVASAQLIAPNLSSSPVITASSGDVAAATATATLAAPNSGSWEITQLEIWGANATASSNVVCTITGLMGGTMTIDVVVSLIPATTAPITNNPIYLPFNGGLTGLPGTAVVFSCPSMGSGNLHAAINIHGILVH